MLVTEPPVISQRHPCHRILIVLMLMTLVVQLGSLCESPADVEKHYPTWTTHRSPRHLKEYQL